MNNSIFNKLQSLRNRYQEIEILLTQKNIFSNREQLKILSQEYLKLSDIMKYFIKWEELEIDIKNIRSLFQDVEMQDIAQEELCLFNKKKKKLEEKIYQLLLPEDPNDKNSCFIEIRSATGGDESCIFAGELLECIQDILNLIHGK